MSAVPPLSRKRIISCVLMNLLATPGLGSVMARRWLAGTGQLVLSVVGFALMMVWFLQTVGQIFSELNQTASAPPSGRLGLMGVGLFALAWVWSLVTSLRLLRSGSGGMAAAGNATAGKLAEPAIQSALAAVPEWRRSSETIARTLVFSDFAGAMKFVNAVAAAAEQAQHHPDVDIRWNRVTLALTTHEAGGLTEKDFALARQCDAFAAGR